MFCCDSIFTYKSFLPFFLLIFTMLFLPEIAWAKCDPRDASVVKYSNCGTEHNCSNILDNYPASDYNEGVNQCFSDHPGSCAEAMISMGETSETYIVKCYGKTGQPTPVPEQCGTLNASCCPVGQCSNGLIPSGTQSNCVCTGVPTVSAINPRLDIFCENYDLNSTDRRTKSAIGCIPTRVETFVPWLLTALFGIIGGVAFLLLIYSFVRLATSGGDPKVIQGAKETITSAIVGLVFSIFSVFILRLILLGILKIPGIE